LCTTYDCGVSYTVPSVRTHATRSLSGGCRLSLSAHSTRPYVGVFPKAGDFTAKEWFPLSNELRTSYASLPSSTARPTCHQMTTSTALHAGMTKLSVERKAMVSVMVVRTAMAAASPHAAGIAHGSAAPVPSTISPGMSDPRKTAAQPSSDLVDLAEALHLEAVPAEGGADDLAHRIPVRQRQQHQLRRERPQLLRILLRRKAEQRDAKRGDDAPHHGRRAHHRVLLPELPVADAVGGAE